MVANTLPPQQDITVLIQEQLSYSRKWKQQGSLKVDLYLQQHQEKGKKIPRSPGSWMLGGIQHSPRRVFLPQWLQKKHTQKQEGNPPDIYMQRRKTLKLRGSRIKKTQRSTHMNALGERLWKRKRSTRDSTVLCKAAPLCTWGPVSQLNFSVLRTRFNRVFGR